MRAKLLLAAAVGASLLAGAAVVQAQDHPGPMPMPMGGHMVMMHTMMGGHERMLADIKTILRIRPDQEAAFNALVETLHPKGGPPGMPGGHDAAPPPADLTTPQMLALHDQQEAEARAQADRHKAAILAFYVVLGPDQQKTFDALMRLHHMMGGMGMGGMGMAGMGGPMGGHDGVVQFMMHQEGPPPPPPAH